MSSYGSNDYQDENDYDSNAEYEFDGNSSPKDVQSSVRSSRGSPKYSRKSLISDTNSNSDVEILSFKEGVKKLFVKRKEKTNEKFVPGLLTRRVSPSNPNVVKLSLKDKKVVKEAMTKYIKKTYAKDQFIIDNLDSILAGKITTKDQKTLDKIEDILQIYLEVSKQISLDRSVQKFMMIEKK